MPGIKAWLSRAELVIALVVAALISLGYFVAWLQGL
jgi:hypothetical protein